MGACKKCKEVFGVLEMNEGVCKGCMSEDELKNFEAIKKTTLERKKNESITPIVKRSSFWGGRYTRVDFLLRSLVPIGLLSLLLYFIFNLDIDFEIDIFVYIVAGLAFIIFIWGLIKRGRDIGLHFLYFILILILTVVLTMGLIDGFLYEYSDFFFIPFSIFLLFFLLMRSSKKNKIILKKFEKIILTILAITGVSTFIYTSIPNKTTVIDDLMWQDEPIESMATSKSWDEAVSYCNQLRLDNYNDWRLPFKYELEKVELDKFIGGAIGSGLTYWSSSTAMYNNEKKAFTVRLSSWSSFSTEKSWIEDYVKNDVLCVRDLVKENGTKSENVNTVYLSEKDMWQDELYTEKEGRAYLLRKEGKVLNFNDAVNYCSNLELSGYSDWSLPTSEELEKLYEKKDNLRNYLSKDFWTKTYYTNEKTGYKINIVVNFNDGATYKVNEINYNYVRCKRTHKGEK